MQSLALWIVSLNKIVFKKCVISFISSENLKFKTWLLIMKTIILFLGIDKPSVKYINSLKGGLQLCVNGFPHTRHRLRGETTYWRCVQFRPLRWALWMSISELIFMEKKLMKTRKHVIFLMKLVENCGETTKFKQINLNVTNRIK